MCGPVRPKSDAGEGRLNWPASAAPNFLRRRLMAGIGAAAFARAALAAPYEERPIKLIALEAGAQSDSVARIFAPALGRALKQELVIENHGGAGGRIAARMISLAAPNGLTLGVGGANNLVFAGFLKRDIGYDPERGFTLIAALARVPFAIGVRMGLDVVDVRTLVALARKQPGSLTFGSAGVGGSSHLALLAVEQQFNVSLTHVPFRGSSNATVEMLAGRIDVVATDLARLLPHAAAGKIRIIGVTGTRRSLQAPGIPTLAEQGMDGFYLEPWYGLIGPAELPSAVTTRLAAAVREVSSDAEVKSQIDAKGLELLPPTAETLQSLVLNDRRRFASLVEKIDLAKAQ